VIADEYTQLVFHVFAQVPLAGPGDVWDPRYVAWAATRFDAAGRRMLEEDTRLLALLFAADARHERLHAFAQLHASWAGFEASATRSLAELGESDVADRELLGSVRGLDGAELLHTTLGLLGAEYLSVFAGLRRELELEAVRVRGWIERLAAVCPGLETARIELVWALGLHGRALSNRILIGAPWGWSGCTAARQAVLAAHEHTVASVGGRDYVDQEWAALTGLAKAMRDAEPDLREAHRDWLASLDLRPLTFAALARGYVDPAAATKLLDEPDQRADRLRAARAAGPR